MAKLKSQGTVSSRLPVLVNAEHLISQRLDEMLAFEPYLANPDNVYELHEMRIAAKRLRYTMEIFQDVYTLYTNVGPEFGKALKAVKALQEHLGVLHDADVLVPQLLEHTARVLQAGYGPQASPSAPKGGKDAHPAHGKGKSAKNATHASPAMKDTDALPIAGVHRVDYLACQGLLDLCTKTRNDRDARYAQLGQDWQRLKNELLFDRLRQLIATPTQEETAAETTAEAKADKETRRQGDRAKSVGADASAPIPDAGRPAPAALPLTIPHHSAEDTENVEDVSPRKNPQVQRAPGEPGHVAAARRRVPARPNTGTSDAAHKGKEGSGAEAIGAERSSAERSGTKRSGIEAGTGKREAGRDTGQNPKSKLQTPKSGATNSAGHNGSANPARHSRPGADTDTGAGEGGAE